MNRFEEKFLHPDRQYAIYPIIHGAAAATGEEAWSSALAGQRLSESKAAKLEKQGFAGIVGNIPYGPHYPDDPKEWEDAEKGFRDYIRRGMKTWIYDEKGYPSGSAGGVVLERHPDRPEFQAVGLYCYEYWRTLTGPISYRADVPGDKLEYAMLLPLDGGEAIDVTSCQNEQGTLYMEIPEGSYHLFMMSSRRLFDGTHAAESYSEPRNYINLCDADATRAFLEVTHEKYAEKLGDEFGKGIRAFFTDEPSLIAWNIRAGVYPIVPWHQHFRTEFEKQYGYPVSLAVVAVVTRRGPEMIKRRCDFWEFVAKEVSENYFGVIQNWCRQHGLASSGHMLEEERLQAHVYNYGSLYQCAKRMDWPGIDQLDSEPQRLMNTKSIPIARLLASFADVYGSGESFTEFSDHTSRMEDKQIGMNWIRSSVNWHYAMGINNMTSYYNFENFKEKEIQELNLYTARLGYMIRQGKRMSRVALLYPESSIWATYTPSTEVRAIDYSEDTVRIGETFAKASWELIHRQIDFDYIDEQLIADGEIKDGGLEWNGRRYECLMFPACHVLTIATVKKLKALLEAGVGVVLIGDLPKIARDTGKDEGFYEILSPYLGRSNFAVVPITTGWTLPGMEKIPAIPRPVTIAPHDLDCVLTGAEGIGSIIDGEVLSPGMLTHTRILEDGGLLVFVCNMGGKIYDGELRVKGGLSASRFDPEDGSCTEIPVRQEKDRGVLDIRLRPYEGFVYLVEKK